MTEDLFPNLEQMLAPLHPGAAAPRTAARDGGAGGQSFRAYRLSQPARATGRRRALYLSRVGGLTATQESVVEATADYLGRFFDLPLCRGKDFDPAAFPPYATRRHPVRGHPQILTGPLINDVLSADRPEEALICLAVTAWDLCSDEHGSGPWGSGLGEAWYGHTGAWSLCHLGDPGRGEWAFRGCVRRSCAVATHEALHVLGLDHCADVPCLMRGSACLSGPLLLCPSCFRKLCWNRQFDLLPYLERLREFLAAWAFSEDERRVGHMMRLLAKKPWKKGCRRPAGEEDPEKRGEGITGPGPPGG